MIVVVCLRCGARRVLFVACCVWAIVLFVDDCWLCAVCYVLFVVCCLMCGV